MWTKFFVFEFLQHEIYIPTKYTRYTVYAAKAFAGNTQKHITITGQIPIIVCLKLNVTIVDNVAIEDVCEYLLVLRSQAFILLSEAELNRIKWVG